MKSPTNEIKKERNHGRWPMKSLTRYEGRGGARWRAISYRGARLLLQDAGTEALQSENDPTGSRELAASSAVAALPVPVPDKPLERPPLVEGPPPIEPPEGVRAGPRIWFTEMAGPRHAFCGSHRGPPWVDKDNEDFAFAVRRRSVSGDDWALAGVCDGVSNSVWSERGAEHAAAAFINVVTAMLAQQAPLEEEMQTTGGRRTFAERLCDEIQRRFRSDAAHLEEHRVCPNSWAPRLYEELFLDGPRAEAERKKWFQTTLLGGAVGPRGGFLVMMGDGFVGLERSTGLDRGVLRPVQMGKRRAGLITRSMDPRHVLRGVRGVLPETSTSLRLVFATDGVSESPNHDLERAGLQDMRSCAEYLEELAARPLGQVEPDNMSVASLRSSMEQA